MALWWLFFTRRGVGHPHHRGVSYPVGSRDWPTPMPTSRSSPASSWQLSATSWSSLILRATPTSRRSAAVLGGPALYLVGNMLFKRTTADRLPLSHLVGLRPPGPAGPALVARVALDVRHGRGAGPGPGRDLGVGLARTEPWRRRRMRDPGSTMLAFASGRCFRPIAISAVGSTAGRRHNARNAAAEADVTRRSC